MITKGRVVLFRPTEDDSIRVGEPLVGHVAWVHSDGQVNLCVIDANGMPEPRTSVKFTQREDGSPVPVGDEPPREGEYAVPLGAAWCSLVPRE